METIWLTGGIPCPEWNSLRLIKWQTLLTILLNEKSIKLRYNLSPLQMLTLVPAREWNS